MAEYVRDEGFRTDAIVSQDSELLILVDDKDRELGYLSKASCHEGQGVLHRAFSIFIFNSDGDLLLQQRSALKRLWPQFWSNSCCSHPRRGESLELAAQRRLREELGMRCPLQNLFKFRYQAQFDATGAEHELCSVFLGVSNEAVTVNTNEVQDWRWMSPRALQTAMQNDPAHFTPWFVIEWQRIWAEHRELIPHVGTER